MLETGDSRLPANNIFKELYWLVRSFIRFLAIFMTNEKSWNHLDRLSCDGLILYLTKNQKNATKSIEIRRKELFLLTVSNKFDADIKIPWGRYGVMGIVSVLKVFHLIRKNKDKENLIPWLDECVGYIAGKKIASELFEIVNPKCLIFSNDHSGVSRGIISQARKSNIKLIYTQHAVVGKNFPRLKYDLSLLDGYQSLINYKNSGKIDGIIVLTGRQKIKIYNDKVERCKKIVVGCATNPYDDIEEWDKILNELIRGNFEVLIRLHPRENRLKKWRIISSKYNIQCSELSLDNFIRMSNVTISGVSGFALDSVIRGVPNITIMPKKIKSERMNDYFNFMEYKITEKCKELSGLNELIRDKINNCNERFYSYIYDAGCVYDPDLKKYNVIEKYISNKFDSYEFKRKLASNKIDDEMVFESTDYCNLLNEKFAIR